jgi:hypothetical protein
MEDTPKILKVEYFSNHCIWSYPSLNLPNHILQMPGWDFNGEPGKRVRRRTHISKEKFIENLECGFARPACFDL